MKNENTSSHEIEVKVYKMYIPTMARVTSTLKKVVLVINRKEIKNIFD